MARIEAFLDDPRALDVVRGSRPPLRFQTFHKKGGGGGGGEGQPKPTVDDEGAGKQSAGVLLTAVDTGRVLAVRERTSKDWEYSVPFGKKDLGDTSIREAGRREYEEETGHPVPIDTVLDAQRLDQHNTVFTGTVPTEADVALKSTGRFEPTWIDPRHPPKGMRFILKKFLRHRRASEGGTVRGASSSAPLVIMDVAHNAAALRWLHNSIGIAHPNAHVHFVVGLSSDKDPLECFQALCGASGDASSASSITTASIYPVTGLHHRALGVDVLSSAAQAALDGARVAESVDDAKPVGKLVVGGGNVGEAIKAAFERAEVGMLGEGRGASTHTHTHTRQQQQQHVVVVCGSIYLMYEALLAIEEDFEATQDEGGSMLCTHDRPDLVEAWFRRTG